jgi:pyrroline-5-carboxylate reductase
MIGFIGGGKMAEALIKGIVAQGNTNIFVAEILEDRRRYLETTYGIKTTAFNKSVAATCATLILAVKPQDMAAVLDEVADEITEDRVVVSVAAALTLEFFQRRLKTKKIVRVMPNTPVFVKEGMTALAFNEA